MSKEQQRVHKVLINTPVIKNTTARSVVPHHREIAQIAWHYWLSSLAKSLPLAFSFLFFLPLPLITRMSRVSWILLWADDRVEEEKRIRQKQMKHCELRRQRRDTRRDKRKKKEWEKEKEMWVKLCPLDGFCFNWCKRWKSEVLAASLVSSSSSSVGSGAHFVRETEKKVCWISCVKVREQEIATYISETNVKGTGTNGKSGARWELIQWQM